MGCRLWPIVHRWCENRWMRHPPYASSTHWKCGEGRFPKQVDSGETWPVSNKVGLAITHGIYLRTVSVKQFSYTSSSHREFKTLSERSNRPIYFLDYTLYAQFWEIILISHKFVNWIRNVTSCVSLKCTGMICYNPMMAEKRSAVTLDPVILRSPRTIIIT